MHAEPALALGKIHVERRVLEDRTGVAAVRVVADDRRKVDLHFVGQPTLDNPAFQFELRAPDAE
ncbi:hypothetical protein D3C83_318090 [compost metagenome]